MPNVLVLYYSSYGHIEQMADAVADGARSVGANVEIRRVAETAPPEIVTAARFKTDAAHPLIDGPDTLAQYDAIIVGGPGLAVCRARWRVSGTPRAGSGSLAS